MKNIVLIGFMATGKTSVGRLLARRLGRSFVDVDQKIEQENGMTIAEMFAKHGEDYFRAKERELISRVARNRNAVIATGGGVVLFPDNMSLLRANGIVISLSASVEAILERAGRRNTRPLLEQPDREQVVSDLLQKRSRLYREADYCVDNENCSPHQTVEKIVAFLRQEGI